MACVELTHLIDILKALSASPSSTTSLSSSTPSVTSLLEQASSIKENICTALEKVQAEAKATTSASAANVLPYEVDGLDAKYYMDDANVPSLLSLPAIGYMSTANPIYAATRNYVLAPSNPYWFSGTCWSCGCCCFSL